LSCIVRLILLLRKQPLSREVGRNIDTLARHDALIDVGHPIDWDTLLGETERRRREVVERLLKAIPGNRSDIPYRRDA
jgi:hypothetical protein